MAEPQALRTRYEEASALEHEYLRAEVYAMAGGTPDQLDGARHTARAERPGIRG